jgi:hypothetical protein
VSPIQRQTARARRARARMKLIVTLMIAYGYAMLGAALWQPLSSGAQLDVVNAAVALAGLAMHGVAVYVAPDGEGA